MIELLWREPYGIDLAHSTLFRPGLAFVPSKHSKLCGTDAEETR